MEAEKFQVPTKELELFQNECMTSSSFHHVGSSHAAYRDQASSKLRAEDAQAFYDKDGKP
jgi:hypothetical protein